MHADFGLGGALLFGLNSRADLRRLRQPGAASSHSSPRRGGTAAGITGGLLAVSIVVDMVHRVVPDTDWFSRLSPVYYYNLSKPLIPSYGTDPVALLVLLVASSVLLSGAAIWLFVRRDVGGRSRAAPHAAPAARAPMTPERALPGERLVAAARSIARSLRTMAVPTFWWTFAIAGVRRLYDLHRRADGAATQATLRELADSRRA